MTIIKRGRITFYIKEEVIIVSNNDFQYLSYSVYSTQSRKNFTDFRDTILKSKKDKFNKIYEVVELSNQFSVYGSGASKPNLENEKYKYKR